jgi:hypothetical protein
MKIIRLRCPSCKGEFDWFRHPSTEEPPRFCALCGFDSAGEAMDQAITMPHVRSGHAKNVMDSADQTYRDIETGSAARAMIAEGQTGENASGLKITDLNDNMKVGDIAAKDIPPNPVSEAIARLPNLAGFGGGQGASEFARTTGSGFAPHAGRGAAGAVGGFHKRSGHAIVAAGEKGRY